MLENLGVEFHSHAYVHAVGKRAYAERFTYLLHPLAAAPTYRNYALIANVFFALGGDFINWIWDGAKEVFEDLKKRALTWGGDMINGFIDGIKAKIEDVKAAASSVANAVKNFLHFSRPDVGPLREYEKWMPDFMAGLAKGINQNKYLVTDEIKDLADEMRIDGNFDTLKIDKSGANGNGKLGAVSVVQYIYSKAQTASDLMQEALYQQKKAVLLGNV